MGRRERPAHDPLKRGLVRLIPPLAPRNCGRRPRSFGKYLTSDLCARRTVGRMNLVNISVEDTKDRPFLACDSCRHPNMSAVDIRGNLAITNKEFPTKGVQTGLGCRGSAQIEL